MPARGRSEWRGAQVKAEVIAACVSGTQDTIDQAVRQAKFNHPGWQNRTGLAEGSIRPQEFAAAQGPKVHASWGSVGVSYMRRLEKYHGHALQGAADIAYKQLVPNVRKHLS